MSTIRLINTAFAYPQQASLIEDCSIDFLPGWTGVVGRNGEGKSTLLDLVDGTLTPQVGRIDSSDLTVARCRQIATMTEVEDFATDWTKASLRWMSLLELEPEDYWRWDELSPGVRRKWQIGAAMARDPGALLLDEPTNHLDLAGRELLIRALQSFNGVGIVVSHDRDLLDWLCDRTARIRNAEVRLYVGGYTEARGLWEAEAAAALGELEAAQQRVRDLGSELRARSHKHSTAMHGLSTKSRMSSINDSDAREARVKGRAQNAEAKLARDKSVTRAQLERSEAALREMARPEATAGRLFVDAAQCPRTYALQFDGAVSIDQTVLAENMVLNVERDSRIWLTGPNGCGKTTLLRAALNDWDLAAERLLYIPQRLEADSVRRSFSALDPDERQRALYIGASLLLDAEAVLDGTSLSPGEVRKLAMSVGLVRQPWLIVLDEPTNDLDVDAIERLEAALSEYPGAILLVTHDPRFAQNLGCETLEFQADR